MAWRGIHLSRSAYLSVEHQALKINFRDEESSVFQIPLEDLSYLIIDTPEVSLSSNLLARLADTNAMVLGVDHKHRPAWMSLPSTRFHRQGEVLLLQLEASQPQKKQLWAHIVRKKILAQSLCLARQGFTGSDSIAAIAKHVRSGDPDNTEARAARAYWQFLFPERQFRRHDDDLPNALLNYGYSLIRAALSRFLCASGFVTQLGIHHTSLSNAYNLADDLIEPYRPIIDHHALKTLANSPSEAPFETDHRRAMAQVLESELVICNEVYSMMGAIESTASSLKQALKAKEPEKLVFPEPIN